MVPPEPPLSRPSRLGVMTASACSASRNCPTFRRSSSRFMNCCSKSCPRGRAGYSVSFLSSASSSRTHRGLSTGFTSRISPYSTMWPDSLPLYLSRSFSSLTSIQTAGPVTAPSVAGDHGAACAIKTAVSGDVMRTQVLSCCQPIPNSPQSSRCALLQPIAVSWSRVHSLARFKFGEPVSRGPIPSSKAEAYSITWEWLSPSLRISWYMLRSRASRSGCGTSYDGRLASPESFLGWLAAAADKAKAKLIRKAKQTSTDRLDIRGTAPFEAKCDWGRLADFGEGDTVCSA